MFFMALFVDNLNALIDKATEEHGISKNSVLASFGFDSAQYRRYVRENLPFSESMLKGISESKYLQITYEQLRAWKAMDELSPEVLRELYKMHKEEGLID